MLVIGHRGAGTLEPENTVRSFVRAEREGVDELELDLRLTRDGRLVVLHDATVDRTTSGAGPVRDLSWDEVSRLDAGSGEGVPLFDEVLDATTLPIQTELKAPEALEALITTIETRRLHDRLYITSQSEDLLRLVRSSARGVTVGLIVPHPDRDTPLRCRAAGATVVCPGLDGLTADVVAAWADEQLRILPWPVNTRAAHDAVTALGVAGFATDRPDLVRVWHAGTGCPTPYPEPSGNPMTSERTNHHREVGRHE